MITPKLEELILCGKAFFKTAVLGGNMSTLNIENDRFIIITDITYLPFYNTDTALNVNINMQVSIVGERGFNHYFFRNHKFYQQYYYDGAGAGRDNGVLMMCEPQSINCYILHTKQVGFSFLTGQQVPVLNYNTAAADNPTYDTPLDYGKDGDPGAVQVPTDIQLRTGFVNQIVNRGGSGLGVGQTVTQQLQFPAVIQTRPDIFNQNAYPVINVNYVEILGQPNNIGI
jgi:hypothetical protein